MVSPNAPSPVQKTSLVGDASAQSVPLDTNQTGWGTYSVTAISNDSKWTWDGAYTLSACADPATPQTGPLAWDGCGYSVGTIEGMVSGVGCDSHLQYSWRVYVAVGYNLSAPSLGVSLMGPVGGQLAPGCGPHNSFAPPPSIPIYCCNQSGLQVSGSALSGVATYSENGTDPAELPGFTVHWSGMVSIGPSQVLTSTAPEFNFDALLLAVILPLAVVATITRRGVREPGLRHAKDGSVQESSSQ